MPNSMPIGMFLIVMKKIRSDGIKDPFGNDPSESEMGHALPHRSENKQRRPSHRQIEEEGQVRVFAKRH